MEVDKDAKRVHLQWVVIQNWTQQSIAAVDTGYTHTHTVVVVIVLQTRQVGNSFISLLFSSNS